MAGLKKHGRSEAIAMLGVDAEEGDLFQAHLEQACDRMMEAYRPMYNKLDAMVAKIHGWLETGVAPVLSEPGKYLLLACHLLH